MIYFARPKKGGAIKIGYTKDVQKRLSTLEGKYNTKLILLNSLEGGRQTETAVHRRFAAYRIEGTEEFRPGPELTDFLFVARVEGWEGVGPLGLNEGSASVVVPFRCNPEYKTWLDEFVKSGGGMGLNQLIDEAIRSLALKKGFKRPPLRYMPQVRRQKVEPWKREDRPAFQDFG